MLAETKAILHDEGTMTDSLHYIDSYFKGEFDADELKRFEKRIVEDPVFAEELAFYVSSVQVLRNEVNDAKKQEFRRIYDEVKEQPAPRTIRPWYYVAAAAVVAGLAIGIFLFNSNGSPNTIADKYINDHLSTLSVMMSSTKDSMQTAISLYNNGDLNGSLKMFESIVQSNPAEFKATEYAGIVSLRLNDYDKALHYFTDLDGDKRLYANPGKFYQALTLLKRNLPGDETKAKTLLRQVVDDGLQNDQAAKELLDQL